MNKNILLDIPSGELLFGFDKIKESIIYLLEEREPRYTIGIYGEWGSGKTTLMESIYQDLINKNRDKNGNTLCIPVWFNPWRYENEEDVVIPLLLQIRQTLSEALDESNFSENDKNDFQERFVKTVRALAYGFSGKLSLGVAELSFSAKDSINQKQRLQIEKDFTFEMRSIYFDIIKHLEKLTCIGKVDIKYFVFIDDLDRCLPDKGLKLLEHIKTLFDMKGFVFIIGLDTRSIKAWIKRKYGADSFISSKDYVEKLIQIPFVLPKVQPAEFIETIKKQKNLLDGTEITVLYDIKDYLPQNARSLKKILNDYLLIKASYGQFEPDTIFRMLILRHRWERCYNDIMRFGSEIFKEIVNFVKESIENDYYKRDRILFCLRNKNYPSGFSFGTFQSELDEQTKFESGFIYFEYFKDYVFDPLFIEYIKSIFSYLYLFSVDYQFNTEDLEDELNKGTSSEYLLHWFDEGNFPLSDNAIITKRRGDHWVITDRGKRIFVRKEDGKLNIYTSFSDEEMEEFFRGIPRTCMLSYVEDFQSRWG